MMKCVYCLNVVVGDAVVEDDKLYHTDCLEEHHEDQNDLNYSFIDEYFRTMEQLKPYLENTLRSDRWVIVRSNKGYGIYDVVVATSYEKAIKIVRDPDFDRTGYDTINAVYHDGRELDIIMSLSLE